MTIRCAEDARFELEAALRKHRDWAKVIKEWRNIAEKNTDGDPAALQKWFDGDPENARYFQQAIDDVLADTMFLMRRAQMWWIMEMMALAHEEMITEANDARIDAAQLENPPVNLGDKIGG